MLRAWNDSHVPVSAIYPAVYPALRCCFHSEHPGDGQRPNWIRRDATCRFAYWAAGFVRFQAVDCRIRRTPRVRQLRSMPLRPTPINLPLHGVSGLHPAGHPRPAVIFPKRYFSAPSELRTTALSCLFQYANCGFCSAHGGCRRMDVCPAEVGVRFRKRLFKRSTPSPMFETATGFSQGRGYPSQALTGVKQASRADGIAGHTTGVLPRDFRMGA